MQTLTTRLEEFRKEMLEAFKAADWKHPNDSVMNDKTNWSDFDWDAIKAHTVEEFAECILSPHTAKEWADLANMAFLMWWHTHNA